MHRRGMWRAPNVSQRQGDFAFNRFWPQKTTYTFKHTPCVLKHNNGSRGPEGGWPPRFFQNHAVFRQFWWKNPYFEQSLGSGPPNPGSKLRWVPPDQNPGSPVKTPPIWQMLTLMLLMLLMHPGMFLHLLYVWNITSNQVSNPQVFTLQSSERSKTVYLGTRSESPRPFMLRFELFAPSSLSQQMLSWKTFIWQQLTQIQMQLWNVDSKTLFLCTIQIIHCRRVSSFLGKNLLLTAKASILFFAKKRGKVNFSEFQNFAIAKAKFTATWWTLISIQKFDCFIFAETRVRFSSTITRNGETSPSANSRNI